MNRGIAAVLLSEAASTAGDQVARIALAILVFGRTHSPALSAATIAVSYLPWAVAAPLLAGLGDRYPRRTVMVCSDAYRMLVCATLCIPGLPTAALLGLVFLLTCGEPPFRAARNALLPDLTDGAHLARTQAHLQTTSTTMQFAGYAVGGFLVAAIGARGSLAVDAASFGVSATALRALLPDAPAPSVGAPPGSRTGWSLVAANPVARRALGIAAFVTSLDSVSFGLAVPWAHQLHHGAALAGLIAAAGLSGAALGSGLFGRIRDVQRRERLLLPLTALLFLCLTPLLAVTDVGATLALLLVAGACSVGMIVTQQAFILAIPPQARARAAGVAGTVLNLGQGVAVALAGGLAQHTRPSVIVGGAGVVGLLGVATLALPSHRGSSVSAAERPR